MRDRLAATRSGAFSQRTPDPTMVLANHLIITAYGEQAAGSMLVVPFTIKNQAPPGRAENRRSGRYLVVGIC